MTIKPAKDIRAETELKFQELTKKLEDHVSEEIELAKEDCKYTVTVWPESVCKDYEVRESILDKLKSSGYDVSKFEGWGQEPSWVIKWREVQCQ